MKQFEFTAMLYRLVGILIGQRKEAYMRTKLDRVSPDLTIQ